MTPRVRSGVLGHRRAPRSSLEELLTPQERALGACGRLRDARAFATAAGTHMPAGTRTALRADHVAGFLLPALALEFSEGTSLIRVCVLISHVQPRSRSHTQAGPTSRAEQQRSSREPQERRRPRSPTAHDHDTPRSTALAHRLSSPRTPSARGHPGTTEVSRSGDTSPPCQSCAPPTTRR